MRKLILMITILLGVNTIYAQDLIVNGDMEIGAMSVGTVPTGWSLITGTPDHCTSVPATSCMPPLTAIVPTNSPQGGKWTRFFCNPNNNERFGQFRELLLPGKIILQIQLSPLQTQEHFGWRSPIAARRWPTRSM
ncbi:MAG: hypothetical protein JKY52_20885 [Flavobacteriales bacterium]|nr:hypothetical protein [Flavobacteriales bacterium]